MSVRIAPSILSADFAHLADDVAAAEAGGTATENKTFLGTFVARVTAIIEDVVPAWARAAEAPSGGTDLPAYEQAETSGLFSRAGALFWRVISEVPNTPGDASGIGHTLTVTGENDRDFAWRAPGAARITLANAGGLAYNGAGELHTVPSLVAVGSEADKNKAAIAAETAARQQAIGSEAMARRDGDTALDERVTANTTAIAANKATIENLDNAATGEFISVEPASIDPTVDGFQQLLSVVIHNVTALSRPGVTKVTIALAGAPTRTLGFNPAIAADRVKVFQLNVSEATNAANNRRGHTSSLMRVAFLDRNNNEIGSALNYNVLLQDRPTPHIHGAVWSATRKYKAGDIVHVVSNINRLSNAVSWFIANRDVPVGTNPANYFSPTNNSTPKPWSYITSEGRGS